MRVLRIIAGLMLVAGCAAPTITPQPTPASTPAPTPAPTDASTPGPASTPADTPGAPTSTPEQPTIGPTTPSVTDLAVSAEPIATVNSPLIFFTSDGAGAHYAVGQDGVVYVVGLDGAVQGAPFLDIGDRIVSGGEQGLLGLAFHPDFASNGRFFVNYTDGLSTIVSEFGLDANGNGDSSSERVVLNIGQPFANHNGGMIAFGPDGYLYIGMGDGGSGGDPMGNGQAPDALLGKMLRIDVDSGDPYGIPADNPFVDGSAAPEIWSMGWRNPWRWSFDRETGDLFVGDVGQGDVEEIDAEPAGQGGRNYGWNTMEGDLCFRTDPCDATGLTLPVVANHRENGECAIIGGYVYRGTQFPQMQGTYLYSDNCTGDIWAFNAETALASGTADPTIVGSTRTPTSFGEDQNGELYLVNGTGEILKLVLESRP